MYTNDPRSTTKSESPPSDHITCPQCGYVDVMRDECWRCGVVFAKYRKHAEKMLPDVFHYAPRDLAQVESHSSFLHTLAKEDLPKDSFEIPRLKSAPSESEPDQHAKREWGLLSRLSLLMSLPLETSLAVCAHLEDALSFDLDLRRALNSAPLNAQQRAQAVGLISDSRSIHDQTLAQQLKSTQLLPERAIAQLDVAELYQRPHHGLSEARRMLERGVQRRQSLSVIRRLPIYVAIYCLISSALSAFIAHESMITLTTIIGMVTLMLYIVAPYVLSRVRWTQWGARWRRSWDRRELQLTFIRTLARLLSAETPLTQALPAAAQATCAPDLPAALSTAIPPEIPLNMTELWPRLHALDAVYHDTPPSGVDLGELARSLAQQGTELACLVRAEDQSRRVLARIVAGALIVAYISYQILTQLSRTVGQLNQLNLGTEFQVPF